MVATDGHLGRGSLVLIALVCAASVGWGPPAGSAASGERALDNSGSCGMRKSAGAFKRFVAAYNAGDPEKLDRLFASEPAFEWYSSPAPGARSGNASMKRNTLMGYFARRFERGDRLRLTQFDFNGRSRGYSNFGLFFDRRAAGFRGGGWYGSGGKGAVTCREGRPQFIVISLGGPLPQTEH